MFFLLHCESCHHEWESTSKEDRCSWCGAASYVLEEKTNWLPKLKSLADRLDQQKRQN